MIGSDRAWQQLLKKRGDFLQVLKMKGELRGFAGNEERSVPVPPV